MLNNFIDFLLLFGHFVCFLFEPLPVQFVYLSQAGEDLEEDDDDKDDEATAVEQAVSSTGLPDINETTPLIHSNSASRSRSRSKRRRNSVSVQGTATVTQAVFMVIFLRDTDKLDI